MTASHPIFCYGTLRPGAGNHRLWMTYAEDRYDDECYVVGYGLVTNGHFPYLVPAATAQSVGCLIYPFMAHYSDVLYDMDRLEGVPSHYQRIAVPVIVPAFGPDNGIARIVTAWTYTPAGMDWRISNLPDVRTDERGFHNWRLHMRSLR